MKTVNSLSYSKNYLKIYFWQGISIVMNFLSMFIVLPRLSESPSLYGVYSLCIATIIFLSYADFGFLGASYKFASESFSRKNLHEEIAVLGFAYFILMVFTSLFSAVALFFSFHPEIVIKNLMGDSERHMASVLFLILSVSSFIITSQRWIQLIFGIRLEDYKYQRISLVGSLLRILSVFYFFNSHRYDIVGYFIFSQIVYVGAVILGYYLIKKRYGYKTGLLLKSIRFSRTQYNLTKSLAYSSFYVTVLWVIYIEFDPFVISKLMGAEYVAYYAIGLTIYSFLRTMGSSVYGPFQARFNHFIGLGDTEGLKNLFLKVLILTAPVITFSSLSIVLLAKPLVINWVGSAYLPSIPVVEFLILGYLVQFVSQPTNILVISLQKIRLLYVASTITVVLYWAGVAGSYQFLGLESFALFRSVSAFITALVYLSFAASFLKIDFLGFCRKTIIPLLPGMLVMIVLLKYVSGLLPLEKGKANLVLTILAGAVASLIGSLLYILSSKEFRLYFEEYWLRFRESRFQRQVA